MNVGTKSTNEIRMIAVQAVESQGKICDERRGRLSDRLDQLTKRVDDLDPTEAIVELKEAASALTTQIKITWALLLLVVSGLVGVAFSVWGKMP